MELSLNSRVPDGLLAAMTLLSEKPHQGLPSWESALHPGIDEHNCTAVLGLPFGWSGIVSGTVVALKNALLQSSCKQAQIPVTHDGGGGSIDIPKIPRYAPLDDDIPDGSDESDEPDGGGQVTIQPGFTVLGN
jgi:hypothetical protein